MNIKNIVIYIKHIFKFYLIYTAIFGVIIFGIYKPKSSEYLDNHSIDRFFGENVGQDRVALIEDRYYSGLVRLDIIENAEETLDISYYTIHDGISTDIFLASLIEAADRGVQVRFILDGIFHHLEGNLKNVIYAFSNHPNIELKFYEPFNIFKPWTWNNRLHDKFIIADNNIAIIGGRNIGDKYFAQDDANIDVVNDRDVLILNTDEKAYSNSVISEMEEYFNLVWNHKYSVYPKENLSNRQITKGEEKTEDLKDRLENVKNSNPEIFENDFNWEEETLPTNKITLIHNPIQSLNKEPWVYYELTNLARNSKESILIQSPYIIPTRNMLKILDINSINVDDIDVLTNSLYASPNPFAIAGYTNHRKNIVDNSTNVYEFQGPGSIHAKSYIFDERISAVGSFNFDSRSVHLSTETMVIIDSEEFSEHLKEEIEKYMEQSLVVGEDYNYIENSKVKAGKVPFIKKIITGVLSVVVYLFEFML